jgi:ribosomal protein S27AE
VIHGAKTKEVKKENPLSDEGLTTRQGGQVERLKKTAQMRTACSWRAQGLDVCGKCGYTEFKKK